MKRPKRNSTTPKVCEQTTAAKVEFQIIAILNAAFISGVFINVHELIFRDRSHVRRILGRSTHERMMLCAPIPAGACSCMAHQLRKGGHQFTPTSHGWCKPVFTVHGWMLEPNFFSAIQMWDMSIWVVQCKRPRRGYIRTRCQLNWGIQSSYFVYNCYTLLS